MKKLFLIITAILFISQSFSQVQEYVNYHIDNTEGMQKAEIGTYQFIVKNPKLTQVFTTDILYYIEKERKEDKDVFILISDYTELYIPSRKKILSKDFKLLEEFNQ